MAQVRDQLLLKKIAERVKELREERDLTQQTVFDELDVHVARIETAKVNITVSTLSKLCDYFGISLTEFFKKIER